jgi:hypothetical protein
LAKTDLAQVGIRVRDRPCSNVSMPMATARSVRRSVVPCVNTCKNKVSVASVVSVETDQIAVTAADAAVGGAARAKVFLAAHRVA